MAKDIVQATNNKGVAGWSLKTDDNATVDPTINWQEGQMPSTVNNSARAMMARIREEHDIVNYQLKAIINSSDSNFLYAEVGSYTLKGSGDGKYELNIVISDKLTDAQYADFKAGRKKLAVYSSNDTLNDSVYNSLTTQDVIDLSLSIPTASTAHLWDPYVRLSFFGTQFETNRITIHELSYILNNLMEYVAEKTDSSSNELRTVRSIPMNRSYVDFKTVEVKDDRGKKVPLKISWHYISPCEIILTVEPSGPLSEEGTDYVGFNCDFGIPWVNLTFLDCSTPSGVLNVVMENNQMMLNAGACQINSSSYSRIPPIWDGIRYRFHAKLTTDDQLNLYPMIKHPGPGKTYPIIT